MSHSNLLTELNRRGMFRVAGAYLVSAWAIAKISELALAKFNAPEWGMQLVLIILMVGFPLVLALTWIHDLASVSLEADLGDGSEVGNVRVASLEAGTDENEAPGGQQRTVYTLLSIAAAVVLLAFASLYLLREDAEEGSHNADYIDERNSIAVLPFANLGGKTEDEFFSDGVSEELLNLLARIQELRVISRSSAFSYKGKRVDMATISSELNVDHILEGSVRKQGEQVRINVQLVEARTDTQLWAETYNRRLVDIFAVQDEIAEEVVAQLKLVLLAGAPSAQRVDPAAYTLFLQGRHLTRMGSASAITEGIEKLRRAIAIQPDYSDAWSELGFNQIRRARLVDVSEAEVFPMAYESLNRAVAVNPENATAHSRLGWLAMSRGELQVAADHMSLALELARGNLSVLVNTAQVLSQLERHDDALTICRRALSLDPTSASAHWNYGDALFRAGDIEEALRQTRLAKGLGPDYLGISFTLGEIYLYQQNYEAALAAFREEGSEHFKAFGSAMALYSLDRLEEYAAALEQAKDTWGEENPADVAAAYLWAGEFDAGLDWMEQAWIARDRRLFLLLGSPLFTSFHADPRWQDFLERLRRSPQKLASIRLAAAL